MVEMEVWSYACLILACYIGCLEKADMKLIDLAFACYIYNHMSDDYDSSYKDFLEVTEPELDFQNKDHLMALLVWLNKWGCRQFSLKDHELAANELAEWHKEVGHLIFDTDKTLLNFTEHDFNIVEQVYGTLVNKTASNRQAANGNSVRVEVGPTGASKILFAWRPQAFIPWDGFMRLNGEYDGSAKSYADYLRKTREHLVGLSQECRKAGFEIADLPSKLGRSNFSLTKLMDEYYWVTITRKCRIPDLETLKRWISWS